MIFMEDFMLRKLCLTTLFFVANLAAADPQIVVDCDAGQSLNKTLSHLKKTGPTTILVKGTCTEYVHIDGFDRLTVNGMQGATVDQPSTDPTGGLGFNVFEINASRSVTVSGFAIHARPTAFGSIGIRGGSVDVRIRNSVTDGSSGIVVYEASQVSLARVTAKISSGPFAIFVADRSDVHLEESLLTRTVNTGWSAGLFIFGGHVTMHGTIIRNMPVGIDITNGSVDMNNFNSYYPRVWPSDVVISNPAGTSDAGVAIQDTSALNLGDVKLRITNAGQPWSAAVQVTNGSTMEAGANLVVSGSQGQGVLVANNSHVRLAGSSITANAHGGLAVANLSSVTVDGSSPLTEISGNGTDLFCDSRSQIAGAMNVSNATIVNCKNLLPELYENLP
jgi:hypothetical protein